MAENPVLELSSATVARNGQRILDTITLRIDSGEHTAILGPNGSGKSSLIKLLTHQYHPLHRQDGVAAVRVLGEERWNVSDLRTQVGIVSPDLERAFVSGGSLGPLTGIDAVISGFFASQVLFLHHEVTKTMRDRARAALDLVGAGELTGKRMDAMSTGETRRVMIARALVNSPPVLVLDEPTAGLDVVARDAFLARLRRIAREEATVLLITHHVEEILPEIGRVILLRKGRVAFDGPKLEAMQASRLREVFEAPVALLRGGDWFGMSIERG